LKLPPPPAMARYALPMPPRAINAIGRYFPSVRGRDVVDTGTLTESRDARAPRRRDAGKPPDPCRVTVGRACVDQNAGHAGPSADRGSRATLGPWCAVKKIGPSREAARCFLRAALLQRVQVPSR